MLTIRRSAHRGHTDQGWLDTYHTFSFARYHDADHVRFSVLRVVNEDRIAPGRGFGAHGHRKMEIVSYVLDGVLEHRDSMGHGAQVRAGDVQLLSAGTGVTHSEFNASSTEPLHLLQMWVIPREHNTVPDYQQNRFPRQGRRGRLRLAISPDGRDGSLTILQDAWLYAGLLAAAETVQHRLAPDRCAWLQVARGSVLVQGEQLHAGDGAALRSEPAVVLEGVHDAEILLWDLPE